MPIVEKREPWYHTRLGIAILCTVGAGILSPLGIYLVTEITQSSRISLSGMVHVARCDTSHFLGIPLAEGEVGVYWLRVRNTGNSPQTKIRVRLDRLGNVQEVWHDGYSKLRGDHGELIEELRPRVRGGTLEFSIESLPPETSFYLRVVTIQESIWGPLVEVRSDLKRGRWVSDDGRIQEQADAHMVRFSKEYPQFSWRKRQDSWRMIKD